MGKHSKVSSFTNWRLGENIALKLMKCLTPIVSFDIFMDNYFTFFVCLPTFELTTFKQHVCSTKICYTNALSLGTKSCKKRKLATLNKAHSVKKQCNFDSRWLERQQFGLKSLLGVGTKLKESIFKSNNQINCIATTRTWDLSTELTRTWPWYSNEKMVVDPICLNGRCCSSGCMSIALY